jgi:hypothetical protein
MFNETILTEMESYYSNRLIGKPIGFILGTVITLNLFSSLLTLLL